MQRADSGTPALGHVDIPAHPRLCDANRPRSAKAAPPPSKRRGPKRRRLKHLTASARPTQTRPTQSRPGLDAPLAHLPLLQLLLPHPRLPHLLPQRLPHLLPRKRTLPCLLQHLLPFGGSRGLPALAQCLPALQRQTLEPAEVLAHSALSIGRQRAELLPAPLQRLPLGGWQRLPSFEALPRRDSLRGRHVQPSVAAVRERLLPLRRQAPPPAREARQEPLLIGGERGPRNLCSAVHG